VAETLAGLAGQALERARLYEAEHAAAHQLQRALLPQIPAELPGASIGALYRRGQTLADDVAVACIDLTGPGDGS
jgi:GAF domain-containing protein